MKTLMLLCSALIIGLSSLSSPSQAREGGYGGFTYENIQEFYDYIHGQEMIKVQTGEELDKAINAIPINLETAIDLEQERGLRNWLRQYLIAFSESGNDSLAAVFYLREGFNEEQYKTITIAWAEAAQQYAQSSNVVFQNDDGSAMTAEEIENIVEKTRANVETDLMEQTPMSIFRSEHRKILSSLNKKYFIENVSFHDSEFRIFELNKGDQMFFSLAKKRGMLPKGFERYPVALEDQLSALLETGEKIICMDIMFIVEEPSEYASNPTVPGRTPSFFRLMWNRDKKLWHHLEVFYSPSVREKYLFDRL